MKSAPGTDWDPIDVAARAKDRDPDAFAALFDRYFEKIRRYVFFQTGDIEAADDLAAEVFRQALESIDNFSDRGGSIGSWLYGIARNMIAAHFRTTGKANTTPLDEAAPIADPRAPERLVIERATYQQLYQAISRLPEGQREVVILRFIEGYRVNAVARILGKRPGAVRAQQHRAVAALRRMYEVDELVLGEPGVVLSE